MSESTSSVTSGKAEEKRNELWSLLDKAFTSLYSSHESSQLQKQNIVDTIESVIVNLREWKFLTTSDSTGFYIWLVQQFTEVLLSKSFLFFHKQIVRCCVKLLETLAHANFILFTCAIKTNVLILESIIKEISGIAEKVATYIRIPYDCIIPMKIKNNFPAIEINSKSSFVSVFSSFLMVCHNNMNAIITYAKCFAFRIINLLAYILKLYHDSNGLKDLFMLVSKTLPLLTIKEWKAVCSSFEVFQMDEETLSAFTDFIELSSEIPDQPEVKLLMFKTSLNLICAESLLVFPGVKRFISALSNILNVIPNHYVKTIDLSHIILPAMSNKTLYDLLIPYFLKSLEYFLASTKVESTEYQLTDVDGLWRLVITSLNKSVEKTLSDLEKRSHYLGNVISILNVAMKLKHLEVKYKSNIIIFNNITVRIFHIFLIHDTTTNPDIINNIVQLSKHSVYIMLERKCIDPGSIKYLYKFLVKPWTDKNLLLWGPLKYLCYESLCTLLYGALKLDEDSVMYSSLLGETLLAIASNETSFLPLFVHTLCVAISYSPTETAHKLYSNFLKKCINPKSVGILFTCSRLRNILPCFFAGHCKAVSGECGLTLECSTCDVINTTSEEHSDIVNHQYLNFVGFSFIKTLVNQGTCLKTKTELFYSLKKYVNHVDELKSDDVVSMLTDLAAHILLEVDFSLKITLNCLLFDSENSFVLDKANCVLKSLLDVYIIKKDCITSNWVQRSFEFMVDIARLSKDLLLPLLKFYISLIFNSVTTNIEKKYMKDKLIETVCFHNIEMNHFPTHYEKELSKVWVDLIISNIQSQKCDVEKTIKYIAKVFDMSPSNFLEFRCTPYMIAYILIVCNLEQARYLISALSKIIPTPLKDFIIKEFPIIFSTIYFLNNENISEKSLGIIETLCEQSIDALVYVSYKNLICYIVMNAHKPLKLIRFFEIYASSGEANIREGVNILLNYIAGFLTFVDSKLSSKSSSSHIIRSCIRAIPHLMKLLGPDNVVSIRVKLLATLRTGLPLHYNFFAKECLTAWTYFLYSTNLSFLGPYLTTIFTLLKPLYSIYPTDVINIFHYLVVQSGYLYLDYIPELYFVKDTSVPKMSQVRKAIQNSTKGLTVEEMISRTLEHISSGAVESLIHSLQYLHHILKQRKFEILKLTHENDDLLPVFKQTVDCLMLNIHSGNTDVQMTCAKCLGELGAINPARFGYGYKNVGSQKYFDIKSLDFAYLVISEITTALRKSENAHAYNTIATSIQELLKYYFPNEEKDERINMFFEKFSSNERDILRSMLRSRYIFIEPAVLKRSNERMSLLAGKSTFEWASSWASELIALIPPDTDESKLFIITLPAIQLDCEALESLLPHILLHSILTCEENNACIIEKDMKYLLQFDEHPLENTPTTITSSKSSEKSDCYLKSEMIEEKCMAIVLDLIDFLYEYLSYLRLSKVKPAQLKTITAFLNKFPHNFISLKSYMLKDYCRSLLYMEKRLTNTDVDNNITPLRNIYAKLNDADGLLGVIRMSNKVPTTEESLLNHVVCGNIHDALVGYEMLATKYKNSTECYRALIQCYLNTNSPHVAVKLAETFLDESKDCFSPTFCSELVETAVKTLMFGDLDKKVCNLDKTMLNNWSWSIDIGLAYRDLFKLDFDSLKRKIDSIYGNIAERLAAISNTAIGTYRQGYSHIVNLHILNELEKYTKLLRISCQSVKTYDLNKFFIDMNMDLDSRLKLLPSSGYYISNVMSSRIQLMTMIKEMDKVPVYVKKAIEAELGNSYLQAARIARKNSNTQLAHSYLALAETYDPQGLFIERAKLHKSKYDSDTAICILKQGVQQYSISSNGSVTVYKKICAQAKLLIARYNEENMNVDYEEGYRSYQGAINTFPTEKSYLYLAQYLYQIHSSDSEPDSTKYKCDMQVEAMNNFGKSLLYGSKYIYQSMFCMISLWLDYGNRYKASLDGLKKEGRSSKHPPEDTMNKLHEIMRANFESHPTYMYMAVFSQILSRINHPLIKCQQMLIEIISKVAFEFPQQAFWMMAPIWKTEDSKQKIIFQKILDKMKEIEIKRKADSTLSFSVAQFYQGFNELVDTLIDICNKKVHPETSVTPLHQINQKLKLLLKKREIMIMIPSQKFRTISLPDVKYFGTADSRTNHNPFPMNLVYFHDVEDEVQVLPSLQRPKKLTFIGSDGQPYPFMCKPMDDLRLDSRIMEFCSVVNMYLKREPSSFDRNLNIKTYSVVPINPKNGLIEWVPNLLGFRSAVCKMFKTLNVKLPNPQVIKKQVEGIKTPSEKLKLFEETLAAHPPVLHEWFFQQFPSPDSWYLARKSYVRTAAVMSIVGYVVGLGDRHGENILLDTTSGDLVHVDFNCLFGQGEFLTVPEVVPFRLTQNMVKAMGATGIEGHFMKSCEITARVIRNHSSQLLYVLKPFLYDPKLQKSPNAEVKAKKDIQIIQKKMDGFVITPKRKTQALSVEGQVRCLVAEATSHTNLSQMYHGWTPFL